jgi:hypothetical protein
MKPSSFLLIAAFVSSLVSFGCKSNPIGPSTGKPEITILPDSLHGIEYVDYTFKAKISNYDFAQTYFLWDMGDGTPIYRDPLSYETAHSYSAPGLYTIKVRAYDIYTDSVIATKSENIIIDTVRPTVEIVPQFYNGILKMDNFGNLLESFFLTAKLSNPNISLRYFWDFGDGTKDSTSGSDLYHHFPRPGAYVVKVDGYQANGIFDCTDTALVVIDYTDVSLASLEQMGKVQAVLYLDSSYSISQVGGFQNPLAIGLLFSNSVGYSSSWSGGNFSTHFHTESGAGTKNYELKDFLISASLSSDTKTMNSIDVSVEDTTSVGSVSTMVGYGFKADNAQLVAATPDQIIYFVSTANLKSVLRDATFISYWKDNSSCPGMDPNFVVRVISGSPPPAQLLIVFSKQ